MPMLLARRDEGSVACLHYNLFRFVRYNAFSMCREKYLIAGMCMKVVLCPAVERHKRKVELVCPRASNQRLASHLTTVEKRSV